VLAIEKEVFEGGETTYSPAYLDLPAELISGQQTLAAHGSRAIYEMDGEKYDERSSGWIVLRVVGKEDVTVRAGEFKNCIRVEANGESLYDGMFERESYVTWYYPGIGMVKYEHTDGQDSRMELVKMPE
jgi:hypothetical protein